MKIGQFIASTGWGGAEKAFVELANALSEIDTVQAITLRGIQLLAKLAPRVAVVTLPDTSRLDPRLYWHLLRFIRTNKLHIIHTHAAKASAITRHIAGFFDVKQVATKHNSRRNKVFDKIDNVIAVSQQVAETIAGDATVIYNGITPRKPCPRLYDTDLFTLLAIGRLDPIKDFAGLIRAVAQLDFPFRLQIAGAGPEFSRLCFLRDRLGLNNVELLGFREDIPELMSTADLLVINSLTEVLSFVLTESLFYGNVLISTPISGSMEILPAELLFEHGSLAERIQKIHDNYVTYQKLFARVKEKHAAKFLIKNTAQAHRNYYQRLLAVTAR